MTLLESINVVDIIVENDVVMNRNLAFITDNWYGWPFHLRKIKLFLK